MTIPTTMDTGTGIAMNPEARIIPIIPLQISGISSRKLASLRP